MLFSESGDQISNVVYFDVADEVLAARLAHRRGTESRVDDDEQTQLKRLKVYQEQTAPLVEYYEKQNLLAAKRRFIRFVSHEVRTVR